MASIYGSATYGVATYGDSRVGIGSTSSPQSVTVDLGSVYTLDYLNIMHSVDGRTYHGTKTEVSEDGVHWNPIFDSSIVGEYAESSQGHTVLVNQGPIVYNMSSQIIQQAGEIDAVVDKDGQTGSISLKSDAVKFAFNNINSASVIIDSTGLTVNNGKISANALYGGTMTLGGANNGNGKISILDSSGSLLATIDGNGYSQYNGLELGHRNEINSSSGITLCYRGNSAGTCSVTIGNGIPGQFGILEASGIWARGAASIFDSVVVDGSLTVSGSKNCIQTTEHYGQRAINAYETAEYFFGDIGRGKVKNGSCTIQIEAIFKECVNTGIEYQVFLAKYGQGDIWVDEMNADSFTIKGDNIPFGWELKAKRIGYEDDRLKEVEEVR